MRKVAIRLDDCEPGMKTAETIFNEYGAVIVGENTILDTHIIRKLQNLGIAKIRIYDESQIIIAANSSDIFKAEYNENVEAVKDMLHTISTGKNIDMEQVQNLSEIIFIRINENRDIISCINQIRDVDDYTYAHSVNVSLICMLIAKWMKHDPDEIRLIVQAGLLHDIGKSLIPREILNKPGKLTKDEFEEIKRHPVYGYRALEKIPGMNKDICRAVLLHHEREDGTGYPMGVKGDQISPIAKIIAVADIYDAMTSNRIYKAKESPFEVFDMMENETFGYLDPRVVTAFLGNIAAYYIGDFVKLTTGEIGEIVYINPRHASQPVVKVADTYIDLSQTTGKKIKELL